MSSIVVTGSARQSVEPDRVRVGLGLTAVAADAATALDQVSERSGTLRNGLTGLGFTAADWTTDGVAVAEEWEYRRDANVLVGYRASTAVTVTIDHTDRLAPLLRLAVGDAGAQVRDLRWQVDDAHPVRRELLGRAALDARQRAQAYTSALGLSLGAVELISESPITGGPSTGDTATVAVPMRLMAAADSMPEMAVSGGQIELAAEVHVRFAILSPGG